MIAGKDSPFLRRCLVRCAALCALLSAGGCVVNPVPTPGPEGTGAVVDNTRKNGDGFALVDATAAPATSGDAAYGPDAGADAALLPADVTAAFDQWAVDE